MSLRMVIPAEVDFRDPADRKRAWRAMKADPEIVFTIRIRVAQNAWVEAETVEEAKRLLMLMLEDDKPVAALTPQGTK